MKAPRMMTGIVFFSTAPNGDRIYRQIPDEILDAFEGDIRNPAPDATLQINSIGMMLARIRAAEKDRDDIAVAVDALLGELLVSYPNDDLEGPCEFEGRDRHFCFKCALVKAFRAVRATVAEARRSA